jgi:hypothetical protein
MLNLWQLRSVWYGAAAIGQMRVFMAEINFKQDRLLMIRDKATGIANEVLKNR